MIPNAKLLSGNPQYPIWRLAIVHWAAKLLGVTVHADGFPLGSARLRKASSERVGSEDCGGSVSLTVQPPPAIWHVEASPCLADLANENGVV